MTKEKPQDPPDFVTVVVPDDYDPAPEEKSQDTE